MQVKARNCARKIVSTFTLAPRCVTDPYRELESQHRWMSSKKKKTGEGDGGEISVFGGNMPSYLYARP